MVGRNYDTELSHDDQIQRRLQVLYASHTREKQIFLEELKDYRKRKSKQMLDSIVYAVGPKWYQALSVQQRCALDALEISIYQDLLEGRPVRSAQVMHQLGLVPCPHYTELMPCVSLGRDDPKEMLAELYYATYGYPINGKRTSYCLNARLILSAILYLGLDNLIHLLEKTFAPTESTTQSKPKPKPKPQSKLPSPYLQKMVAVLHEPPRTRRKPPLPMPDLTELNEPYEEEPVMRKPPPPPPPPPPPKKRLPIPYCEQLAGINTIKPHVSPTNIPPIRKCLRPKGKISRSKTSLNTTETGTYKKKYGIGVGTQRKKLRRRRPVPPTTNLWNAQYTINGVFEVRGKTCFVLGNVTILPALGELIHGGYAFVGGQNINIHCGFRGLPPDPTPDKCDCVKQWQDAVFLYAKNTKCDCGHYFDFGNDEGHFSQDDLPYFTKASRHGPLEFHYDTIYDLDSQRLFIEKTFKKVWETDSVLRVDDDANKAIDNKKKKKKAEKDSKKDGDIGLQKKDGDNNLQKDGDNILQKKDGDKTLQKKDGHNTLQKKAGDKTLQKKDGDKTLHRKDGDNTLQKKDGDNALQKKDGDNTLQKKDGDNALQADEATKVKQLRTDLSRTCLGTRPKITDYLKCALQLMRKVNVAARLPDLHLVPELKEWMRKRLYGKFTYCEKKEYLRKSSTYWRWFTALAEKGFGHVSPPKELKYGRRTTWAYKQCLNDDFKPYTERYKLALFKSHAYVTNLLWRTMYQPEFPDKKFREIYFSYMFGRVDDIQLIHPYCTRETMERKIILMNKRYVCLPAGFEAKS